MIAGWAARYLSADTPQGEDAVEAVRVSETLEGKFQNTVHAGRHRLFADEPVSVGGLDSGPSPYDFLSVALAACTSMTLRMYANFKKADLGRITVDVSHAKIHASDCAECAEDEQSAGGKIDRFERRIMIEGEVPESLHGKIEEIADKCPVHRTLENNFQGRHPRRREWVDEATANRLFLEGSVWNRRRNSESWRTLLIPFANIPCARNRQSVLVNFPAANGALQIPKITNNSCFRQAAVR